ncbi:MAG: ACT domain-containing protein, partial [Nitrospirota bacterium]
RANKNPIIVKGIDDILIRFGKCCTPLKGDPIVGFITRGRGITVHTTDCPKIFEMDSDRKIDVEWDKSEKSIRKVKIRVVTQDFPGVLAKMSKTITNAGGNIATASIRTTKDRKAVSIFEISFASVEQLNMLIAELEKINEVIAVERLKL